MIKIQKHAILTKLDLLLKAPDIDLPNASILNFLF